LHQRGYRTHVERAPLRETLAAAMVQLLDSLARQHGKTLEHVWDPFCGSGVLPLEWLRRERGVPPGAERSFAFEAWPTHPHEDYAHYRQQRIKGPRAPGDVHALGSDIDAKAIRSAVHNAEQSGLLAHTTFWQADFREAVERIPEGTALLANPPYGKRIGSRTAARQRFVDLLGILDARPDLRPVVLACPDPHWLPGKGWQLLVKTRHGGVPLFFLGLASAR
jgi:putative N6-adenine-specific DNA methylase